MERRFRKRSSSVGSEKRKRADDREDKMEGHCLTGQSPQRAAAPMEEKEEYYKILLKEGYEGKSSDQ